MKVITFGEIMLRLAPQGNNRFFQNNQFEGTFGGGEANVAVSLANYGVNAAFISKLPNHQIADAAIRELRGLCVDTTHILRGGNRMGIYFLEKGASQRGSEVIYDRDNTSISTSERDDYDWDRIFEGSTWFHFTGITPALGDQMVDIVLDACKVAKDKGITISCDLNYRQKLWTPDEAQIAMERIAPYIDVLVANEEDSEKVFGISSTDTNINSGTLNHEGYIDVARKLVDKYKFKKVIITLRESINADENNWSGLIYENGTSYFSPTYKLNIVDRVGGGDSLAGGLIYSLVSGYDNKQAIDFAVAASCLKHSINGDYNRVTLEEVKRLISGDGSGRVQR